MIKADRFALNRIAAPALGLAEFFELAAGLGFGAVELRNDIRDGAVTDGLSGADVRHLAESAGVRIVTINALQQFNLPAARSRALAELDQLLGLCQELACPALVLCPNNRPDDLRTPERKYHDTVEALNTYAPLFTSAGVLGYVEPLGFGISSLASASVALKAIRESGASCYRVLIDTFHSYLGPDDPAMFDYPAVIGSIGLVHISGVEASIPKAQFSDAHRLLVGPGDVMHSAGLVARLERSGYKGLYSFEPFSEEVQRMKPEALRAALASSLAYLSKESL
jgi:2-keto-myo-inositol isomerase